MQAQVGDEGRARHEHVVDRAQAQNVMGSLEQKRTTVGRTAKMIAHLHARTDAPDADSVQAALSWFSTTDDYEIKCA